MSDMKHDFSTPLKFCLKLKLRELHCVTSKEIRQTNKHLSYYTDKVKPPFTNVGGCNRQCNFAYRTGRIFSSTWRVGYPH
jgi:hypothetical protein